MIISETLTDQTKQSDGNNFLDSSFKFVLTSTYSTITLSESMPFGMKDLEIRFQDELKKNPLMLQKAMLDEEEKAEQLFSITASIRKPIIELFTHANDLYISLKANDVSIYEMNYNQYLSLISERFDFHQPVYSDLLRIGPEKFRIPFLYRSIFNMKDITERDNDSNTRVFKDTTLLTNNKNFGYIFDIRLLLSQHTSDQSTLFKSVSFSIDFYNMKIFHDPKSTWLLKVVNLLSPRTDFEMARLQQQAYFNFMRTYLNELQGCEFLSAPSGEDTNKKNPVQINDIFEMTRINARVVLFILYFHLIVIIRGTVWLNTAVLEIMMMIKVIKPEQS